MKSFIQLLITLPFAIFLVGYIYAVFQLYCNGKTWPIYRTVLWIIGNICAAAALIGPLAERAHHDFVYHMAGHLLLGMLAPLLMALAAPMTLLYRTVKTRHARRITSLLRSGYVQFISDPAITSLLNIGGLWLLYTTNLYSFMLHNPLLHLIIHFHVFAVGYLFTISMIYIDPTPFRKSFVYRAVVFVIALAGHGILSKFIYAYPPINVPRAEAELGGMIMYYGGDAIDIVIIYILCYQWYKAVNKKTRLHQASGSSRLGQNQVN